MGYPYEVYREAEKELAHKKALAEDTASARQDAFAMLEPRYSYIKSELSKTAIKTARIVLSREQDSVLQLEALKKENLYLQEQIEGLLKAHGYDANYLEPAYSCSECNDTGYVDGYMCRCLKKLAQQIACQRINKLSPLSLSTFESMHLDYYPDNSEEKEISARKRMQSIISFCKDYAENFTPQSQGLMFMGATGLGKTHLSLAIANEVIKKGYGVVYGSVQSFMTQIEQEHFSREHTSNACRNMLIDCDLLILDDLGSEFSTSFTVSALYDIINSRIAVSKATVINTNLSLAEIEARYTERIVSRICGCFKLLRFDGKDIRIMRN